MGRFRGALGWLVALASVAFVWAAGPAQAVPTYTFSPAGGPEGTPINVVGDGCPPNSQVSFVLENGPGRGAVYPVDGAGHFDFIYPAPAAKVYDPGDSPYGTFPTSAFCMADGTSLEGLPFTVTAPRAKAQLARTDAVTRLLLAQDGKLVTSLPDLTDLQPTGLTGQIISAEVSPDGTQVAFATGDFALSNVEVANIDGTNRRIVAAGGRSPTWHPDGKSLLIGRGGNSSGLQTVDLNTQARRDVPGTERFEEGFYLPDGTTIAALDGGTARPSGPDCAGEPPAIVLLAGQTRTPLFSDDYGCDSSGPNVISGVSPDGSSVLFEFGGSACSSHLESVGTAPPFATQQVTQLGTDDLTCGEDGGVWSPGGDEIVFFGLGFGDEPSGSFAVNADGSGRRRLSTGEDSPTIEDWYVVAGATPSPAVTTGKSDELPPPSKAVTEAAARAAHASGRSPIALALRAPKNVSTTAKLLLTNVALAVGMALLVFPAVLFNSTYEDNYDRIHKRRKKDKAKPGAAKRWLTFIVVAIATAALASLLDPKIKADRATALLVIGVATATVVSTLLGHFVKTRYLKETKGRIRGYPGGVLVGAITVGVSRLVNFLPGYLYGIVGGFESEPKPDKKRAGRAALLGESFTIALAVGTWFAWQPIADRAAKPHASAGIALADAMLSAIAALSFQGLLFSMIPIKPLPGETLWKWNKTVWAVFMTIGAFSFLHVLAHPASKYTGSVTVMLALFGAFGVFSIAFWAWFRIKKPKQVTPQESPVETPVTIPDDVPYFAKDEPAPLPLREPVMPPPLPPTLVNGRPKRDRPLRAPGRE